DVPSSFEMAQAADVREAGVLVGRVAAVRRAGTVTALELAIDPQYLPIYRNATVLIRAKSIADEKYVQLDPGTPQAGRLADGSVLGVTHALQAVQDDDVFSILAAPERRSLSLALRGLGSGLSGVGGLRANQTLEALTSLVDNGRGFAQILDSERTQTAQLLHAFDGVASALGSRARDIQTLTDTALTTARAVSARNADLRALLVTLPGFLSQSRTTATRLGGFATTATPVFANLRVAFDRLVPAVHALGPAARAADTTLGTLDRFATVALPAFARLSPFARTTSQLIGPYARFLRQLAPLSRYLSPYWRETGSWFANAGAAVNAGDSVSKLARIILPISRSNFPTVVQGKLQTLLDSFSGGADTRGSNPYPAAGAADRPGPLSHLVPALGPAGPYDAKPPRPIRQ
ncbi:MAG TPA: MlaD family protein, partial [Solirubrobacteraceae bacterium]|nr:MlaD family protein [Solirubrobacteraceae bacterium]